MSTHNKPLIDSNVPMGPSWFDFVTEDSGLSVNEIKKVYDHTEVPDPVTNFWKAAAANRFEKAGVDPAWSEQVGVVSTLRKLEAKAVRYEVTVENGDRISKGYDSAGELVHWRVLLPEIEIE